MKIFAVFGNYGEASESNLDWYEIPDSSILRTRQPFFIPDFSKEFAAMPSVALRISRLGKGIAPRFACRYITQASMGAAVVATSLLESLRKEGRPWSRAVAFDKCCWLGDFIPVGEFLELKEWKISCEDETSAYAPDRLREGFEEIISRLSRDITLKEGDIILAGLRDEGVKLTAPSSFIIENNDFKILDIHVR